MYKILPVVLLLFSGCATPWSYKPMNQAPNIPKTTQEVPKTKNSTVSFKSEKSTGYIKGVIQTIEWNEKKGLWLYDVAGTDTKNGKLSQAIFTHNQKLYGPGTLVYAQIKSGELVEMYKVSNGGFIGAVVNKGASKEVEKSPTQKRTKARQKISLPETETILLD